MGTVATRDRVSTHPLDQLSADEVESAATILRESDPAFAGARFVSIALDEPAKEQFWPTPTVARSTAEPSW
jgi:Cu2+-containing amine oxidase